MQKRGRIYKRIEIIIDKIIPYTLVILLFIILRDILYPHLLEEYELYFKITDYTIISIFAIDLIFKYHKSKNFKIFLKTSWLDILAVFPFYLILRIVEEAILILRFSESLETTQKILHGTLAISSESEKVFKELGETEKIIAEVEKTGKLSRIRLFSKFVQPLERTPRLIKAVAFYEKPILKEEKKILRKIKKNF